MKEYEQVSRMEPRLRLVKCDGCSQIIKESKEYLDFYDDIPHVEIVGKFWPMTYHDGIVFQSEYPAIKEKDKLNFSYDFCTSCYDKIREYVENLTELKCTN